MAVELSTAQQGRSGVSLVDQSIGDIFAGMLAKCADDPAQLVPYAEANLARALAQLPEASNLKLVTIPGCAPGTSCCGVTGCITVGGKRFAVLLSEDSFNQSRSDQCSYAERIGYDVADEKH